MARVTSSSLLSKYCMFYNVLITQLEACEDLENDIDKLLEDFEARRKVPVLHSLVFY